MILKGTREKLFSGKFEWILVALLVVITFAFSWKDYAVEVEWTNSVKITKINNFYIFSNAYKVLDDGGNLYTLHPEKHYDYYKYSPTFAFLMAPFALMPDLMGLISWNWLNLLLFLFALKVLPGIDQRAFMVITLVVVMELVGSIQNEQSNGLMTALIILFVSFMERNKPFWAIAFLMLSVFIKLFSLIFLVMLIMYPGKVRNTLYTLLWTLFLFFLPAIMTGFDYLLLSYERWFLLLQKDHGSSVGYSVMGIFHSWFGLDLNKIALVLLSLTLNLIPLIKIKKYSSRVFKYSFAASLLIWVVIFNHKAESPLFVIAMMGVALWYIFSEKSKINIVLLLFAISFVSLAFSDLTPATLKHNFFYKFSIKALPCLIIWGKIIFDLLKPNYNYDSQ